MKLTYSPDQIKATARISADIVESSNGPYLHHRGIEAKIRSLLNNRKVVRKLVLEMPILRSYMRDCAKLIHEYEKPNEIVVGQKLLYHLVVLQP
jgi:hypothetical protein